MFFAFKIFFFVMSFFSFVLWNYVLYSSSYYLFYISVFSEMLLEVKLPILLDWMGVSVVLLVNVITFCVFGFSECYLGYNDKKLCLLISGFVVGMWFVCLIPSLASVMIGWDILGMVSYKLILHYPSDKSVSAGNFTVFANRVGDAALVLAVGLLLVDGNCMWVYECNSIYVMGLIVLAAITKSAGYPFMAWLPEAMAAPTPVSALVHSSTLVTAGILLLARFNFFVKDVSDSLFYIGLYVCWLSGMCAMFEMDVKKVVALSTLSQLGVMMLALGLNCPLLSFFHLCTHACFKSLLFITVGVFIKFNGHVQDLRHFGLCFKNHIFSGGAMVVALTALVGAPFLSGFYSKDLIYDKMVSLNFGVFSFVALCVSLGLTSGYSLKMCKVVLTKNFFCVVECKSLEEPKFEMFILSFMSILFGWSFLGMLGLEVCEVKIIFLWKVLSVIFWVSGVIFVLWIEFNKVSEFFSFLGMLSIVSKQPFVYFWAGLNKKFLKLIDHGLVEKVLGQGQMGVLKKVLGFYQVWQDESWSKSFFFLTRGCFLALLIGLSLSLI